MVSAQPHRRFVSTKDVRLAVQIAEPAGALADAPNTAPLVLLLHGFPEGRACFRRQIPALAAEGYRVLAPDQRGYGESDKPRGSRAYRLPLLVNDALGLLDAAGAERAHIIGHDWGGAVAWWLARTRPERVASLSILNCPHPLVLRRAVLTSPRQMLRSWYMAFFQLPWLPEAVAAARDHALLVWGLRSSSRPGTFSEADLEAYRRDWRRPGALRAMIHWYRALRWPLVTKPPSTDASSAIAPRKAIDILPPTLILWGRRDRALGAELAPLSLARCAAGRLVFLDEASHWLQHEEPERVNALLLAHLAGSAGSEPLEPMPLKPIR
ncbi:MAG: alpha/beta fold hydrolase [Planctomycetota bacterium]